MPGSQNIGILLLYLGYFFLMVPFTVALAAASFALSQPQLEVKQTSKENTIEMPADILFDFDKADIRPGAGVTLEQAAKILRDHAVTEVRIEGFTDAKGTTEHNLKLSMQRADAVRGWLVDRKGLSNVRFTLEGLGAAQPVEPNLNPDGSDNPSGRTKNRRAVVVFAAP
jgi:outer membrane protein OmpA-like peptidoglycan-associated protein